MLDVPLSTPDGKRWKALDPATTPEVEEYFECQHESTTALRQMASNNEYFKPWIWPLEEKKKDKTNLAKMWTAIDKVRLRNVVEV